MASVERKFARMTLRARVRIRWLDKMEELIDSLYGALSRKTNQEELNYYSTHFLILRKKMTSSNLNFSRLDIKYYNSRFINLPWGEYKCPNIE